MRGNTEHAKTYLLPTINISHISAEREFGKVDENKIVQQNGMTDQALDKSWNRRSAFTSLNC